MQLVGSCKLALDDGGGHRHRRALQSAEWQTQTRANDVATCVWAGSTNSNSGSGLWGS